jgi:hypothetical protein
MNVADFTEAEQEIVSAELLRRYGKQVAMELADSELQLDPSSDELSLCPTIYWTERGAQFVICKVADSRYRCQFFYTEADHYGTGKEEYQGLHTCVVTLLQVQSDHERQQENMSSGATAANLEEEYHGPLVI